ncbi:hypothetical protein [Undibacter mobilis]|uniref:Uncharacterized protein n=1 Tax=Undibacter mobilis TaxID=2292256 RepID=A0A371B914_9BRAD|nr:hypothetical protein [Undibacter mobilis]RDV04060.1 hypothetical protein DXH78_05345 [Undibacter mobilis]
MRTRKQRSSQAVASDRRLHDEIEADVFEIWIGVSRLMSRLREPYTPFKASRRPARRRRHGPGEQRPENAAS